MSKKALLILAQQNYQDREYERTRAEMERGGLAVTVAAGEGGSSTGRFGGSVQGALPLKQVNVTDFDCIAFIGGPGAEAYVRHPEALRIAHEAVAADIPLGAICIAPLILAKARVLEGRKATVWDDGQGTQEAILTQAGAEVTGDSVTRDGCIVTANGAEASEEFGRTLLELTRS
ncbi:MAG: DJ-1/PfpI family protein [Candidatus Peribacteraceae bacterium]|nr:DJ-1/PfpI family protein [Candidatus Peribacteraceae bacterium]MDD5742047.1 DJ-1/PfpI family protein [Candidatus Peribacteraceae bacterium]